MKFIKGILITVILLFVGLLILGSVVDSPEKDTVYGDNNYDGSYTIRYADSKCGQLGYEFKKQQERYGISSMSKIRKSNCKINENGNYEGYVYPKSKNHRHLRVFWVYSNGQFNYK